MAASWKGGTGPAMAVRLASAAHSRIAPRPCPAAAGLPVAIAWSGASGHVLTAIGGEGRAGYEARRVGRQECYARGDFVGLTEASDRDLRQDLALEDVRRDRLDHLGADVVGGYAIDGNVLAGALLGEGLGEADDASFRGRVIGLPGLALLAIDAGDVDDAPEAPRAHPFPDRPRHVEKAVEVGADHGRPLFGGHPVEKGVARDAGIIHENLDRPQVLLDLSQSLDACLGIAHVPLVDGDAGLGFEFAGGFIVAGVDRRNLAARILESPGNGRADAARAACHDC